MSSNKSVGKIGSKKSIKSGGGETENKDDSKQLSKNDNNSSQQLKGNMEEEEDVYPQQPDKSSKADSKHDASISNVITNEKSKVPSISGVKKVNEGEMMEDDYPSSKNDRGGAQSKSVDRKITVDHVPNVFHLFDFIFPGGKLAKLVEIILTKGKN